MVCALPSFDNPIFQQHRQFGLPWRLEGVAELARELAPGRIEEIAARLRESGLEVGIGA